MCKYCEGYHVDKELINEEYIILGNKMCYVQDDEPKKKPLEINFFKPYETIWVSSIFNVKHISDNFF